MELTPTQQRLMGVLQDGKPHTKEELLSVMIDPLTDVKVMQLHVSKLRRKLRPGGHDILPVSRGHGCYYRLVRLVGSPDE